MTDTPILDVDALLAEILLTPEGKADPYPRYAAIREHAPIVPQRDRAWSSSRRYEDCQWVLRDPRFGKGEQLHSVGAIRAHRGRVARALSRLRGAQRVDARPRPARPHASAPPRREGVHAQDGREPTARHRSPHRTSCSTASTGAVDVIAELALQLPIAVISEMLGVPESYRADAPAARAHRGGDARVQPDARTDRGCGGSGSGHRRALRGAHRRAACASDRRPALRARPRRGAGRPAQPRGADRHGDPALRRPDSRPRRTSSATVCLRCSTTPTELQRLRDDRSSVAYGRRGAAAVGQPGAARRPRPRRGPIEVHGIDGRRPANRS